MSRRWGRSSIQSRVALLWATRFSAIVFVAGLFIATVVAARPAQALEHGHDVAVGYQSGHIWTKDSGRFHFRSLPMSYVGRYGGRWAAEMRLSLLVPLRARQADLKFSPRADYDRTQQYDAFVGPNLRWFELKHWRFDSAAGPHCHYVRFRSTDYVEWSSAALGLGASTTGRSSIGPRIGNGRGELGLRGEVAYDFLDLSRGGHMVGGLQAQVFLLVGWAAGGRE